MRSEGEFAEDHVPGAINCPVLDNDERARVGTIYKQRSAFEAKKIGAALVSANIARHLQRALSRPPARVASAGLLLARRRAAAAPSRTCCTRSDGASGRLDGGYRAYRRAVVADLGRAAPRFPAGAWCAG